MRSARSFAVVVLVASAAAAQAQGRSEGLRRSTVPVEEIAQEPSPTYGTSTRTIVNVGHWEFKPVDSSVTFTYMCCTPESIFRTGGIDPYFVAPLHLPNGALVEQLQLLACDTSTTAEVTLYFVTQPGLGLFTETFPTPTGVSASPGCTTVTTNVSPPVVINNDAASYGVEVVLGAIGPATSFVGAKVAYRLQVSPAPASATFTDVPVGHPIHRFVEALAAAGITGGCGSGAFCPDNPLTRGQMAVFLATALGLHFPN